MSKASKVLSSIAALAESVPPVSTTVPRDDFRKYVCIHCYSSIVRDSKSRSLQSQILSELEDAGIFVKESLDGVPVSIRALYVTKEDEKAATDITKKFSS